MDDVCDSFYWLKNSIVIYFAFYREGQVSLMAHTNSQANTLLCILHQYAKPSESNFAVNTQQGALILTQLHSQTSANIRIIYILKCNETYPATPIFALDYVSYFVYGILFLYQELRSWHKSTSLIYRWRHRIMRIFILRHRFMRSLKDAIEMCAVKRLTKNKLGPRTMQIMQSRRRRSSCRLDAFDQLSPTYLADSFQWPRHQSRT